MDKTYSIKLRSFIITRIKGIQKSKRNSIIALVVVLLLGFGVYKIFAQSTQAPQYQTAQVERGTLVSSVTASGNISTGNSVSITTSATGVISEVFVQNGDTVSQGDTIATITLDQSALQRQTQAWASYLSAQSTFNAAKSKMNSLQSALFKANQTFVTDRGVNNPTDQQKADPVYIQEQANWLQAEADYNNQAGVIAAAQAELSSAWLAYQQISPNVTAPASGTITNLTATPGLSITGSANVQTAENGLNASTPETLGNITLDQGSLQAAVSLSEIDVTKVSPGQKVTLSLDAFPGKTITGRVKTVNTTGVVLSGVTTYPTTIALDITDARIYPNMAVSAKIITNVKDNVLLVPSQAVQTQNGQTSVRILRNGEVVNIPVEVGESSDTQTEIISGLSEGQEVVTSFISQTGSGQQNTVRSPFGGSGGFGGLRPGGFRGGGGGGGGGEGH